MADLLFGWGPRGHILRLQLSDSDVHLIMCTKHLIKHTKTHKDSLLQHQNQI
jgi:hypothetical protein